MFASRRAVTIDDSRRVRLLAVPGRPDDAAAEVYARIRADMLTAGNPIGPNDMLIAAIAIANGLTLVTHNTNEFQRVSGLAIEDWEV